MAKLYTNGNVPLPVAEELRRLGHDVMTVQESGLGGQSVPGHSVLTFAIDQGRGLITLNRSNTPNSSGPLLPMDNRGPFDIATLAIFPEYVVFDAQEVLRFVVPGAAGRTIK